MFSSLGTKLALKKAGLPSDILDLPGQLASTATTTPKKSERNRLRKDPPPPDEDQDSSAAGWGSWMSIRSLPLTVQPWLNPPPPAVAVGRVPGIGDKAPADGERRVVFGGGRRVLVVFLRCVGCAFAQKTFINLRTLANRYGDALTCVAVSHASPQATQKWVSLLGGAWSVRVVVDEERALYAAWGLGTGGMWYLFNPTTQVQGWKETGWLGEKVAGAIQKGETMKSQRSQDEEAGDDDEGPSTVMGNKWQEAGAFAVDGTGTVIWGGKAARADDVMDLEFGARILMV